MVRCCCLSFSTHLVMLNFRLSKNSVLHFFSPRTTGMTCFARQSCVQWWKWGWKWNRKCPARWPKAETPWSLGPISSPWLENPWCHEILWFGNAKPVFDGPKKAFLHFPASWNSNTKSASSSHVLHIVGFFFMSELSEAQIFHAKLQNLLVLAQIFQTSCCFVQGLVTYGLHARIWTLPQRPCNT